MLTNNFTYAFNILRDRFRVAPRVKKRQWQGVDISQKPEMEFYELLNIKFGVALNGVEDLQHYKDDIKPNLPWADNHFSERVCGEPLNPGKEWANWPYAKSADGFRDDDGQFNHTYMERFWPKYAGYTDQGELKDTIYDPVDGCVFNKRMGIRHSYGDLNDVVKLLLKDPTTNQAWLPIFFPEDTGIGDGGRKPCTLGYQFIQRSGLMHIYYPIRSCDFVRHFRDDCYLAVRLLLWVLAQLRAADPKTWDHVTVGNYEMHCTSLHIFRNDYLAMFEGKQ